MTPFDFVNEINHGKKDIMMTDDDEKDYVPFLVNRQLSYFSDTAILGNEMNVNHHLDHRLQFDFLLNIVRRRKRFSKWAKTQNIDDIEVVKKYYGYSNEKARQVLPLLSEQQLQQLRQKVDLGGTR